MYCPIIFPQFHQYLMNAEYLICYFEIHTDVSQ
jgi:hypothetical protein